MKDSLIFLGTESFLIVSATGLVTNLIGWAILTDTTIGFALLGLGILGTIVGIIMLWGSRKKAPSSPIEKYLMSEEPQSAAVISTVLAVRSLMVAIGVVVGLRGILL